ncbi:MFS transporter [Streptomyces sp. B-S-A8]|uniref:MFS transporter n=1 Tax=Streptomyces solicavernae TaxID=3043614 RepID=A0ABT6RLY3_9ACTN|nr:MFS transporter [Streptomyces sp. B-S-A8]MDI3385446.1 MFS transporter [Streptomyces sp. B-S-A8]
MPFLRAPAAVRKSRPKMSPPVRTTVGLLFAAWFIDYVDRLAITAVLPTIGAEFDIGLGQQGLLVSVFFVAYALCQIPGGMLADRFGAGRVTCWALLAWSVFTAATALAWSFAVLLVVRSAFGAAEGIFPSASTKALVERTSPAERMGAQGLVMSSNALAAVAAPLVVPVLAAAIGWRATFWVTAAAGLLVYGAVRRWLPAPQHRAAESGGASARVRDVLRMGVLWRFAGMLFGYATLTWGLSTWIPSYLFAERGVSLTTAGVLMAVPSLGAAVATLAGGRLADRFEGRHRKVIVPAMAVAAPALCLMALSPSLAGAVVCGTVAVFAASLCYMPIFAVPLRSLPPEQVGVGSAVVVLGGQVAGMTAPALIGVIADASSFELAFCVLALGPLLTLALSLVTPQDTDSFLAALRSRPPRSRTEGTPA